MLGYEVKLAGPLISIGRVTRNAAVAPVDISLIRFSPATVFTRCYGYD
jgi:hypothetical protein